MAERTHELVQQIPEADWVDQDLLTREDSAELLRREIGEEESHLAEIASDASLSDSDRAAAHDLISRRVEAMKKVRQELLERR